MVIVRASGYLFDHQIQYPLWEPKAEILQHWIQDWGVGGVILLGGSAIEVRVRSQQLQNWAKIPLLIAADLEEGVGQRFAGATRFPPPMALHAIALQEPDRAICLAEQMGATTAREALAIGINWLLAPTVDVNNNPANPVINVRAFGETPAIVSQLTRGFIQGAQKYPVLTTAKHFPGHGDTAMDSHLNLPVLSHTQERLAAIEFPPFESAIAAGVDAVMSAHLLIPELDPTHPATLSRSILTDLLRQQMQFDGLIVTDALIMGAIAQRYGATETAVLAVEAGADILLMPSDPVITIQAVCRAVETGRIPRDQIHASLERIWQSKQKACASQLARNPSPVWETPPLLPLQLEQLAQPDAIATAHHILQASTQIRCPAAIGLQRSPQSVLPRNLIVVDEVIYCDFLQRQSPAITVPQQHGYQWQWVDSHTLAGSDRPLLPTLLQLFIRGNPFRDQAGLLQMAHRWFDALVDSKQLLALVIYGSPYVLQEFLPLLPPEVPYGFTYGQMNAAQAIVLQGLFADLGGMSQPDRSGSNQRFTT
jgi:beta-glucosidase